MTNTPHLNLHTWALSDPVSVAEVNENFAAIDGAHARGDATAQLLESALIRTAHRSTKNALLAYRSDDTAYDDTGVWLADFSKGASQVQNVSNLRFVNGCYVLPNIAQQSLTLTVTDDHIEGGETCVLAEFTVEGYGTIESVTPTPVGGSDYSKVRYYLSVDGKTVAATASVAISDINNGAVKFIEPLEIWPGMQLTLSAHGSNGSISNAHIYAGKSITVDVIPCEQENGWLQGKSFSANGASQALIWLYWTGNEPFLELLQNAHEELLQPVNQGITRFVDGTTTHCAYYRAMLASVGDVSLRMHPQAGTRLFGGTALCI